MFSLKSNDWIRGLIVAILGGVAMAVLSVFADSSFDVFSADWKEIINISIRSGAAAFIGYMMKNFFSDSRGAVLGTIAPAGK